jgi:hypothetical protein
MLTAMGAATMLRQNPTSRVAVRDLETGELIVVPQKQGQRFPAANILAGSLAVRPGTRPNTSSGAQSAPAGWIAAISAKCSNTKGRYHTQHRVSRSDFKNPAAPAVKREAEDDWAQ